MHWENVLKYEIIYVHSHWHKLQWHIMWSIRGLDFWSQRQLALWELSHYDCWVQECAASPYCSLLMLCNTDSLTFVNLLLSLLFNNREKSFNLSRTQWKINLITMNHTQKPTHENTVALINDHTCLQASQFLELRFLLLYHKFPI